jgi:hypothetical protein
MLALIIPKDQKKHNNTEVQYRETFYSCHTALDTCCCEEKKSGNKVIQIEALITTK